MIKGITLLFATLVLLTQPAPAQEEEPCFERVMLPVVAMQPVAGAHGSSWKTTLTLTNHGDAETLVGGIFRCGIPPCGAESLGAGDTAIPSVHDQFLWIECDRVSSVQASLRIRDLSRALDTWGTSVPLVYRQDVFEGQSFGITDIPNTDRFRSMLRVYGVEPGAGGRVQLRLFEVVPNTEGGHSAEDLLLSAFDVDLVPQEPNPRALPDIAQVALWTLPELGGAELIRVEVHPIDEREMWAMVSATNNETQHVTILAPSHER